MTGKRWLKWLRASQMTGKEMHIGLCSNSMNLRAFAGLPMALLTILALQHRTSFAQEDSVLGDIWAIYGTVNYSSWSGLGDVQPVGRGGPFETNGVGIDFGVYTSIARLDSVWILAGGELGFLGLNSDVIFEGDRDPPVRNRPSR